MKAKEWYEKLLTEIDNKNRQPLSAHEVLYNAIESKGHELAKEGHPKWKIFEEDIYGIDIVLDKIVRFLKAAAEGQDIGKRILLLIGPPGSSKSTIANHFKIILEEYTEDHKISYVKGSPVYDSPLYILPQSKRKELKAKGVQVGYEMLPSPPIQKELLEKSWEDFEIAEVSLSRTRGIGISTYAPMDPNTADDSALIGHVSLAKLAQYKEETHPNVWSYTGVLQTGNRGMVEFVEMLKAKTEHLNILLTASQDKMIVLKNLPAMYLDMFLLGHTNHAEFEKFINRPETEAFKDRLYIIKVPYNMDWHCEKKILQKLVKETSPVDPLVFEALAYFTTASRLAFYADDNPNKLNKLMTMMSQSNETEAAIKIRKKAAQEEWGHKGISPRKAADLLSDLIVEHKIGVSVVDVLESIKSKFIESPEYREQRYLKTALDQTIVWVDKQLSTHVLEAFLGTNVDAEVKQFFGNYMKQLEAYVRKEKLIDRASGEENDPDEEILGKIDSIFEQNSIYERRKEFYDRIASVMSSSILSEKPFLIKDDLPDVYDGIKKLMFKEKIKLIGGSIDIDVPIRETRTFLKDIIENLGKAGFPERAAKMVLKRLEHMFRKGE
jgi:serine protein kinase